VNIFKWLASNHQRTDNDQQHIKKAFGEKNGKSFDKNFENHLPNDDDFSMLNIDSPFKDIFLYNAWVNIAINILIRNVARADFVLERDGVEVKSGPLFSLFHRPSEHLSRYDLWKETAAWWLLEGEAFWWFGLTIQEGCRKNCIF
jgi:hypothetical protein